VTDSQLTLIGRRFRADDVALEATEAMARWKRDLPALAGYGFGKSAFDEFVAAFAEHAKLRSARPEAVTEKKMSVKERDRLVSMAWAWVDRATSMLGGLARKDQALATALDTATPADDAGLEAGLRALAAILLENKTRLAADAQADKRLTEVDGLSSALQVSPGTVHTSKGQTIADTAQIDLFDGRLYITMRDLNSAGRKAIRNGDLQAGMHEYRFHHVKTSGNPSPLPAPEPPPAPQKTT
jgi:hypothetical protein